MFCIPIDKQYIPLAKTFIEPYEETCVFLSSYLRRGSKHLYLISKKENPQKTGDLYGVIYIESSVFHCIPHVDEINFLELQRGLSPLFQEIKLKCISGEAKGSELVISILKDQFGEPYQTNHYNLMVAAEVQNPPEDLCNDDQIIRCTENDMDELLAIQKKYMNEEVAPFGKKASDAEVAMGLRQILKNQLCLALFSDGEIVAKANTNAIGENWIQLGGIYTHPLYRRNGYAWQLISAILRRTSKAGKKAALFVKDINVPAMELYKKIGFTNSGLYTIGYY